VAGALAAWLHRAGEGRAGARAQLARAAPWLGLALVWLLVGALGQQVDADRYRFLDLYSFALLGGHRRHGRPLLTAQDDPHVLGIHEIQELGAVSGHEHLAAPACLLEEVIEQGDGSGVNRELRLFDPDDWNRWLLQESGHDPGDP